MTTPDRPDNGHDERVVVLSERTRFGAESGAGLMRNRCAFTSRDMGESWSDAFTYAVVAGWDADDPDDESAMDEMAARFGWDAALVAFLRDAHRRFGALADRTAVDRLAVADGQVVSLDQLRLPPRESQQMKLAAELAGHQHLMGARDDERPAQWFSWCECGWDGGPVDPGRGAPADVRAAFWLHVASELLSLLGQDGSDAAACPSRSHGVDGWHCAVEGPHADGQHANAAGDRTW